MERHIISIDTGKDLKEHIEKQAVKKGFRTVGPFIKAILRKHTKFKEKSLV